MYAEKKSILATCAAGKRALPIFRKVQSGNAVWNLLDNTVAMAAKVLRGIYPNDEVNVNNVYYTVFQPCSPCSDRAAAMITKRTANNSRSLYTAEHLASFRVKE